MPSTFAFCFNFMIVHKDLNHLPQFKSDVLTIGTFDGVHLGHRQIIRLMKEEAEAIHGETVIITFHPHPRKIVAHGKHDVKVLNTLREKTELLAAEGIQHLAVVPFNEAFAEQSAETYIENFLVKKFHPHTIIIGYDHRFGKNREGDYHLLENMAERFGYKVREIPEHVLNEVTISSTKIREALLRSDIETANTFLGYHYFFEGKVVEGNKLGRTLGYPTANIAVEDEQKLIPANGVYVVKIALEGEEQLNGMMNIGTRPTINGTSRTIEVNIFDFNKDIYGQRLRVYLHKHLRSEVKFNGLDELTAQLAKDEVEAQEILKGEVY